MKNEQILSRGNTMVILDICLDNFFAFKNFHMNLTYPKKIVGSQIQNETLAERPNFRYKKVNIIMGANASGKTTLGQAIMKILNFIDNKNYEVVTNIICDKSKSAHFSMDMAMDDNFLYRVNCLISPCTDGKYVADNINVKILKEYIKINDSYESCIKRLEEIKYESNTNYIDELEKMSQLDWMFRYPDETGRILRLPNNDKKFLFILEKILKALDPSICKVEKSKDVDNAYIIRLKNRDIIMQNGERFNPEFLSSGTKAGVQVAEVISSLIQGNNTFFYCDEKFTYIHSDLEKAILSLMISSIKSNTQLFFTTHNTDILDMNLPKHAFTFLRKNLNVSECPIESINASTLLKRNTDSLKNAVENDLFCASPSVDIIFDIAEL